MMSPDRYILAAYRRSRIPTCPSISKRTISAGRTSMTVSAYETEREYLERLGLLSAEERT